MTGTIKGSEQTLEHDEGYLDQKTYCALSHRANSTFATQRDTVYNLFLSYTKRKRELGDVDAADRLVFPSNVCPRRLNSKSIDLDLFCDIFRQTSYLDPRLTSCL
jgi:hypothetical protein